MHVCLFAPWNYIYFDSCHQHPPTFQWNIWYVTYHMLHIPHGVQILFWRITMTNWLTIKYILLIKLTKKLHHRYFKYCMSKQYYALRLYVGSKSFSLQRDDLKFKFHEILMSHRVFRKYWLKVNHDAKM
jgi:hypothetical protein